MSIAKRHQTWKERLYNAYVSSGQAGDRATPQSLLSSRAPSIESIIARHIPADKSSRIVDLGCGHGAFLYFLKESGYDDLQGVDVSAEQVELAHQLGIHQVEQGELAAFLDGTDSSSVDVVLLMDVLEHLTMPELFETLDEVFRILAPGGRCIAHVPNAEGLFGMRIRYGDLTHENSFTPQSMRQLFATIGFSAVESHEDRPPMHGLKSIIRRILWDIGTLLFRILLTAETGQTRFVLSQNMLVVAVK
jgi:2-polyprenyl-3-methyl-5-hydroxy-6-metoxy-1,4-benzoquinol methylase